MRTNGRGADLGRFRQRLRGAGLDKAFELLGRLDDLLEQQDLLFLLQLLQHRDDSDCFPLLLRPTFQLD